MFDLIWGLSPFILIYLVVAQVRLKRRLVRLEGDLSALRSAALTAAPAAGTEGPLVPDLSSLSSEARPLEEVPTLKLAQSTDDAVLPQPTPLASGAKPADEPMHAAPVPDQSAPIVLRADRLADLFNWLRANWVYAVSAVSLALAGVFLVQYGIEKGLISPPVRVISGLCLGAGLVGAGEWLRRRYGDDEKSGVAYLPETFAGAGVVAIFAAILAAHQLYGLIGTETAFVGLVLASALALVLGWYHGALMTALGLLGASAVPFVLSSAKGPAPWLYGYYGLIAAVGLGVDGLRRWAWISVLALALGFAGGGAMRAAGAGEEGWIALLVGLVLLAIILPERRLLPAQLGPAFADLMRQPLGKAKPGLPPFPQRLTGGATLVATLCLMQVTQAEAAPALAALFALALLSLAYATWAEGAEGLWDHAFLPAAGFLLSILMQGLSGRPLHLEFASQAIDLRPPETPAPRTVLYLMAMAAAMSGSFALRALRPGPHGLAFGLGAVLTAPLAVLILELAWEPSFVMGAYPWALLVIALAAAMVLLAGAFARRDGADHRRAAHATLAALSLIALSLFLILSAAALNVALAVMLLVAATLDRRFLLPEMGLFLALGAGTLLWRLVIDPGIDHQMVAPWTEVFLGFALPLAAMGGVLALLWPLPPEPRLRQLGLGAQESALASLSALLLNVVITRVTDHLLGPSSGPYAWQVSLNALPWLAMGWSQARRVAQGSRLRRMHILLAGFAAVLATLLLIGTVTLLNPLLAVWPDPNAADVAGPPIFDTLALAYAVPGGVLLAISLSLGRLPRLLLILLRACGIGLLALYLGLEIRRFWQGDFIGLSLGVKQVELYTYTVVMLLIGAGLLYQAIARRSVPLRRVAMAMIGLTVAKVFLIDASGLAGLMRVASFLGLGLALAGLAWLNRWADQRSKG